MESLKRNIRLCFNLIEEKVAKGPIDTWNTHDFEVLSKSIQEHTGTLLSVSTLKRLSGKVKYSSKPNRVTLNALTKYVGFANWQALSESKNNSVKAPEQKKRTVKLTYILPFLALAALIASVFLFQDKDKATYNSNDFTFSGKSATSGLPNSVIFNYDASAASDNAKIEIQQDWDERKRVTVNKNDSVSTSIYYKPGYFKAKLVVDDSIVKEQDILIQSPDWLGVIETDSLPIYLDREDYQTEKGLAIDAETLKKYGIDPRKTRTAVGLYQVRDFKNLYTTDFELTATLKNNFKSGKSLCQIAQIMIICEDAPISIALADKGCISDIVLYAFGKTINGKKTDLSGFGVDFSNYVDLKCISKNQKLNFIVDGKSVFSLDTPKEAKNIVGLCIYFEGGGSIQNVTLKNRDNLVYSSNFVVGK